MVSSRITRSLPFLVAPAGPTPSGFLPLTAMDRALASLPMTALFVFENPIDQPAETIRRALSRALVPYYPLAGRLTAGGDSNDDQQLEIACTGEGVAFAAASATCTLHEASLTGRSPAIPAAAVDDDLAMSFAGADHHPPPLLLAQVTEFACGGFVVAVTWDHAAADGAGMAQFLHAVAEFARGGGGGGGGGGSSVSSPPVRFDRELPELPPPITAMTKSLVGGGDHTDFPSSYITLPLSFIDRVKLEFRRRNRNNNGTSSSSSCSAFDVFTAAIWKCRARATMMSAIAGGGGHGDRGGAPTAVAFTANVRRPARAKAGYYGNVFAFGLAVAATVGEVAGGEVVELVRLVRDAKARVADTFADGGAACVADAMDGGRLRGLDGYDMLYVTSWWNLGLDEVDFCGGGPERVVGNMERKVVPACVLCGRRNDRAEGVVAAMALCVRPEHAEAFHAELRSLK